MTSSRGRDVKKTELWEYEFFIESWKLIANRKSRSQVGCRRSRLSIRIICYVLDNWRVFQNFRGSLQNNCHISINRGFGSQISKVFRIKKGIVDKEAKWMNVLWVSMQFVRRSGHLQENRLAFVLLAKIGIGIRCWLWKSSWVTFYFQRNLEGLIQGLDSESKLNKVTLLSQHF